MKSFSKTHIHLLYNIPKPNCAILLNYFFSNCGDGFSLFQSFSNFNYKAKGPLVGVCSHAIEGCSHAIGAPFTRQRVVFERISVGIPLGLFIFNPEEIM
jgi:hypothetical protein